jgi:hypothetical protein
LDGGEDVVVAFVVVGYDRSEVFEFAEEALKLIAGAIQDRVEGQYALSGRYWADVGDGTSLGEAVLGPIADEPRLVSRVWPVPTISTMSRPDRPSSV